jgi:predicted ATPase
MKIKRVAFWDNLREWRFEPIDFSNLALLVGVSGVGKTQILKRILSLKDIANGESLNGLAWDISFSTENHVEYRWQGEFETKKTQPIMIDAKEESNEFKIVREHIFKDDELLVERTANDIIFNNRRTTNLSSFKSVVAILNKEEYISSIHQGVNKIISHDSISFDGLCDIIIGVSTISKTDNLLDELKASELPIQTKLAVVYSHYLEIFNNIKHIFIQAFPQVEDIKIEAVEDAYPSFTIFPIQLKEKGVNDWIVQDNISSGMLKTLIHISELYLSPEGTVILIDEFENSLGVNCIDVVTDLLLENRNIQFILTSHHPYIINNIGMEHWKIVTRKGGVVTAIDAKDLNLGKSKHQAFTQLINLEEYSEGIKV